MAANKTATKEEAEEAPVGEAPDGALLDLSDQAVRRMIKAAKKRGYVTYDELNEVLPSDEVTLRADRGHDGDALRDGHQRRRGRGGRGRRAEPTAAEADEDERTRAATSSRPRRARSPTTTAKEPADRTDDPVRMYLREMGSVELLSREGEIAIAKRIEAGREAMIAGLCESPLTFQAIIIWRDELAEAKILLRDIIDLEATYAGPEAKAIRPLRPRARIDAAAARAACRSAPPIERTATTRTMEQSSLAAMEAELKPKVVETFDAIADAYKKLRRLQDQNVEQRLQNARLTPAQERKYKKLKDEIIAHVKIAVAQPDTASMRWSSSSTTSTSASFRWKAG